MFGPKSGSAASRNHITNQRHLGQPASDSDSTSNSVRRRLSSDSLSSVSSGNGGGSSIKTLNSTNQPLQQQQLQSSKTMSASTSQQGLIGGNKELNIQVVVRIRGRSEREQKENSPVAVQAHNKKDILVPSTLGDRAPSKSYSFDRVFSYSDQEQIYNEVVTPILDEVLTGYNCTIFAYGQTGTGKTFTMEGDLRDNFGECSRDAGIIPRTLYQLFAILERRETEYTVRVSFLELYNEEIKDLLVPEDDRKAVKIFDNLKKQGPLVQGLEEVAVFNATQGIEALRRGSAKRTVAATKSNDKSSRSHGIFSVTVHVKETTDDGEELLKIGKLNLVDLAGSENIARSGAEATQAKEAGRINQSLLTLGRVINSLVERSQHIPYRESKLTRLLEDSLGGKTKTCIIATISPARSCLEETISTLNYANRAKNIKNTPEINQKMSKKTLIKEYLMEIDRLKADLSATREKNGVFMTQESYQQLMDENTSRKDMVSEVQKQADKAAQDLSRMEEKFRDAMKLLTTTEIKLSHSNAELESKRAQLQKTQEQLAETKRVLEEESILRKAHAHTEKHLNSVAAGLRKTLSTSVKDNQGLHDKLERKSSIEQENRRAIREFQERLTELVTQFQGKFEAFDEKQRKHLGSLHTLFDKTIKDSDERLNDAQYFLEGQMDRITEAMSQSTSNQEFASKDVAAFKDGFESLRLHTAEDLKIQLSHARNRCTDLFGLLKKDLADYTDSVETHHSSMVVELLQLADESKEFSENRARQLSRSLASYEQATKAEVVFLQEQNQQLRQRLQAQEASGTQQKDALLLEMGGLLDRFLKNQTSALMDHFTDASNSLEVSTGRLNDAHVAQRIWATNFNQQEQDHIHQLAESRSQFQKVGNDTKVILEQESKNVLEVADSLRLTTLVDFDTLDGSGQEAVSAIHKEALTGCKDMQTRHEGQEKLFTDTSTNSIAALKDLQSRTESALSFGNSLQNTFLNMIEESKTELEQLEEASDRNFEVLREELESLEPQRLKVDDSTGKTPRRRKYKYPQTWERTRPSQELLKEFRELGRVKVYSTPISDMAQDKDDSVADSDGSSQQSPPSDGSMASALSNSDPFQDSPEDAINGVSPAITTTAAEAVNSTGIVNEWSPVVISEAVQAMDSLTESLPVESSQPTGNPSSFGLSVLRKQSPLPVKQETDQNKELAKAITTSPYLPMSGINNNNNISRPVRPTKGVFSSIPKRSASEMEDGGGSGGDLNNTTTAAAGGLSDISNKGHTRSITTTGVSATLLATPSTGMFSSLPSSNVVFGGTGKSGLFNNGAEGPRKVIRPTPGKPFGRGGGQGGRGGGGGYAARQQ
ncbi:kinesin motor protein cin8 [Gryganskiella cystojenkinii]|nr:kinesin motor protein cin8 [Gryganskiella cystojenkinii]